MHQHAKPNLCNQAGQGERETNAECLLSSFMGLFGTRSSDASHLGTSFVDDARELFRKEQAMQHAHNNAEARVVSESHRGNVEGVALRAEEAAAAAKSVTRGLIHHCIGRADYNHPCPVGWRRESATTCRAPVEYEPPRGCTRTISLWRLRHKQKRALEDACNVRWPCVGEAHDGFTQDLSQICPELWTLARDGQCVAPTSYAGPCSHHQNFLPYTHSMKAAWASGCEAPWPWQPVSSEHGRRGRDGECEHNVTDPCPAHWKLDPLGICRAPVQYRGACPSLLDTRRLTRKMRRALEAHCKLAWPCVDEPAPDGDRVGPLPIADVQAGKLGAFL